MIDYKYDRTTNRMHIETKQLLGNIDVDVIFKDLFDNELWRCEIGSNCWCEQGYDAILYNVFIYKKDTDNLISKWEFSLNDFDLLEKYLYYFCMLNPNSFGLVIGAHDGRYGHWVKPVIDKITDVILVEPSDLQHKTLVKNYKVDIIKGIITNDGREVVWFEGGEGHTNTINKEVINKFLKDDEISSSVKPSATIEAVLNIPLLKEKRERYPNWIHLDTEGSDAELILSLEFTPELIIFEAEHISEERMKQLKNWFIIKDYDVIFHGIDAIALKKH